jgi:hypothetical protein
MKNTFPHELLQAGRAAALGRVVRRTEQADYSAFMFGGDGQDNFFLLHLIDGQDRMDLPDQSTFR